MLEPWDTTEPIGPDAIRFISESFGLYKAFSKPTNLLSERLKSIDVAESSTFPSDDPPSPESVLL